MMAFITFPTAPDITWGHMIPCEPKQAGEFHCLPMSSAFFYTARCSLTQNDLIRDKLSVFIFVSHQWLRSHVNAPDSEDTSPAAGTWRQPAEADNKTMNGG